MKARIIFTDDQGKTFEGEVTLVAASAPTAARPRRSGQKSKQSGAANLDFALPVRAFMNRHARNLGGAQKFTVLLARLTKGKTDVEVPVKEIEKQWNKMTGPMGGKFNGAYPNRAKDSGWVDAPKFGIYTLHPGWPEAVGND